MAAGSSSNRATTASAVETSRSEELTPTKWIARRPAACAPAMSVRWMSPTWTASCGATPRAASGVRKARGSGLDHSCSSEKKNAPNQLLEAVQLEHSAQDAAGRQGGVADDGQGVALGEQGQRLGHALDRPRRSVEE